MMRIKILMAVCMLSVAVCAQKAPKGKFLSYSHTISNPEIPLHYDYSLSWTEGKGTLTIKKRSIMDESEYMAEVAEDVFREVADIIKQQKLYTVTKKKKEDPESLPYAYPGREEFAMRFEDRSFNITKMDITAEQRTAFEALEAFIKEHSVAVEPPVFYPEGRMTYCSCAYTNFGLPVGEIQRSYYELIADEGTEPKIIYCEVRGDSKKTEYRATPQEVTELSNILRDLKIFNINGYNVDERMTGGTSYRIHLEFSSGEKLTATWFTHEPEPLASEAYYTILRYLRNVTER